MVVFVNLKINLLQLVQLSTVYRSRSAMYIIQLTGSNIPQIGKNTNTIFVLIQTIIYSIICKQEAFSEVNVCRKKLDWQEDPLLHFLI